MCFWWNLEFFDRYIEFHELLFCCSTKYLILHENVNETKQAPTDSDFRLLKLINN